MPNDLNDSLDDLIGGDRTTPVAPPAAYAAVQASYFEKCGKCRGTGQTPWGVCFRCKGQKGKTFKTAPEARAKARVQEAAIQVNKTEQAWADFAAQNADVATWIEAKRGSFDFAAKMREAVLRYGGLTNGQHAACVRLADKDAAHTAERAQRLAIAPQVASEGVDRLKVAFDKARAYAAAKATGLTIRNPKITIGGMTISPAGAQSKNPGALYVKERGGEYLGKIIDGRFFGVAVIAGSDVEAKVLQFVADPAAAAKVYGQETGVCCVCNATLKSEWRLRGIGPVCAEKMGWAGLAEDFGMEV